MTIDINLAVALIGVLSAFLSGGALKAVWDTLFGWKKRHREEEAAREQHELDEVQTLQKLSAAFREEVRNENNELRERMDKVVDAVTGLTDTLDDYFPKITGLTDDERLALRQRINKVKRAT
ncbi:hypothetical protein [Mycolicibacterium palauense]|uniref:hypothetical protein n=1 Tax=Mycolicibacterium palauense TaxID=2034511 RepID=UPI000BFEFD2F|nr:hypothetical protein [Mycolicibacterium palauense]